MKKTFLAALAVLTLTLNAQAQQTAGQPTRPAKTEMHQKGQGKHFDATDMALRKAQICRQELRLNDKQYDKVFKAYKTFFMQMDQAKMAEGQQPDAKKIELAKAQLSKQMQKTLSEVQFAEWKQIEKRQHQKAKGGQAHRGDAVRHPAQSQGHNHQAAPQHRGARSEARPDSVAGFRGNSRQPKQSAE